MRNFHEILRCNLFRQTPKNYYAFDHNNFFPEPVMRRFQLLFSVDGEPAAAGTLDFLDDNRAALRGVAVTADRQGQRIGHRFVKAVCEFAAHLGCEVITVRANPGSAGFYLKCGFDKAASCPPEHESPGSVVLQKTIAPEP